MKNHEWNRKKLFTPIKWRDEEEIVDNPVLTDGVTADRVTMSGRGISGKIITTNKRVIFKPYCIPPFYNKQGRSIDLEDIESISVEEETVNSLLTIIVNIASKALRGTDVLPSVPYLRIELSDRFESFAVTRPELIAKSLSSVHTDAANSRQAGCEAGESP